MKSIPNYILYGENDHKKFPDFLHIESIKSRSLKTGWKFKPHQHHNLHQFFYIKSVGGSALIEKNKTSLNGNYIISIPPLNVHGFKFITDTEGWVLTIPDIYLKQLLQNQNVLLEHLQTPFIYACSNHSVFDNLFQNINEEHLKAQPLREFTLKNHVGLLIAKVVRNLPEQLKTEITPPNQKQVLVRQFQIQISNQYKQRLSVAQYANILNITPTHLNRVCRNILDISASQLINERTLLEAKRLLSYTSMSISEIAYDLGYIDTAHFSKFFSKNNQITPSNFRKLSVTF